MAHRLGLIFFAGYKIIGEQTLRNARLISLTTAAAIALTSFQALACTRFLYETGTNGYIVGRSMDWEEDPGTDLWSFPKGLEPRRRRGFRLHQMDGEARLGHRLVLQYRHR